MVLRICLTVIAIITVFASFLYVRTSDEAAPVGATSSLIIWDIGDIAREDVVPVLRESAEEHDVSLVKTLEGVDDAGRATRTLYPVRLSAGDGVGPSGAAYPDFGRDLVTHWAELDDLSSTHVQGTYVSGAAAIDLESVAADLERRGIGSSVRSDGPVRLVLWALYAVPLVPLSVAGLVCVVMCVVHRALTRRRADGVLSINGRSSTMIALGALTRVATVLGAATAGALVLSVPVLELYNGLDQWWRFVSAAFRGVGAVGAMLAGAVVVVESTVRARDVRRAILGARPRSAHAAVIAISHVATVILFIAVSGTGLEAAGTAVADAREREEWSRAAGWYRPAVFSTINEVEDSEGAFAEVAEGERKTAPGSVLIAASPAHVQGGHGPHEGNSLTVTANYLDAQPILDTAGRVVSSTRLDPQKLTLLVPAAVAAAGGPWRAEWADWLEWELSGHGEAPDHVSDVEVEVVTTADSQDAFTYSTAPDTDSSTARDPVIGVLPQGASVLTANWIAAEMTTGGVLFSDPDSLRRRLTSAGLDGQIGSIDRAADIAAIRIADQSRHLRDVLAVAALAAVVVLLSAVMTGLVVAERGRRRDVVLFAAGTGLLRSTLLPAALSSAAGAAVIGLARMLELVDGAGELVLAVAVVVVDLVVMGAVLAFVRSRIRADTVNRR